MLSTLKTRMHTQALKRTARTEAIISSEGSPNCDRILLLLLKIGCYMSSVSFLEGKSSRAQRKRQQKKKESKSQPHTDARIHTAETIFGKKISLFGLPRTSHHCHLPMSLSHFFLNYTDCTALSPCAHTTKSDEFTPLLSVPQHTYSRCIIAVTCAFHNNGS
jgi:hypothetical protein